MQKDAIVFCVPFLCLLMSALAFTVACSDAPGCPEDLFRCRDVRTAAITLSGRHCFGTTTSIGPTIANLNIWKLIRSAGGYVPRNNITDGAVNDRRPAGRGRKIHRFRIRTGRPFGIVRQVDIKTRNSNARAMAHPISKSPSQAEMMHGRRDSRRLPLRLRSPRISPQIVDPRRHYPRTNKSRTPSPTI